MLFYHLSGLDSASQVTDYSIDLTFLKLKKNLPKMSVVEGDDKTLKKIWIFHMLNYSNVGLQSQCFLIINYLKV